MEQNASDAPTEANARGIAVRVNKKRTELRARA